MKTLNPSWSSSSKQLLFAESHWIHMQGISSEVYITVMYPTMTASTTCRETYDWILSVIYLFCNCKLNSKNIIKSILLNTFINFNAGNMTWEANMIHLSIQNNYCVLAFSPQPLLLWSSKQFDKDIFCFFWSKVVCSY